MSEERDEILTRLNTNWPGKFLIPRIRFFDSELKMFANEDLKEGVTQVLRTCEWAPTVAHLTAACSAAAKRRAMKESGRSNTLRPGDMIDGERTLTPAEANELLTELLARNPNAGTRPPRIDAGALTPDERKAHMENVIDNIMVEAYRACIGWDASIPLDEIQDDLPF